MYVGVFHKIGYLYLKQLKIEYEIFRKYFKSFK